MGLNSRLLCGENSLLGVLAYLLEGAAVRVLTVVAPVVEDYDRCATVYGRQVFVPEPLRRQPEVAVNLDVDYAAAENEKASTKRPLGQPRRPPGPGRRCRR